MQSKSIDFTSLAKFQPKQLDAWYDLMKEDTKYLLYGGAMAGGKSYFLRWAAVGLSMYYFSKYGLRDVPIGLFSEDYPTLKDRQISRIQREFPDWLGDLKDNKTDGLCYILKPQYGGGRILLRNLDDPSKYMSSEFAAELVEELTRSPEQTFEDLRNRLRWPGIEGVKFVGATNPGGIGHGWVRKLFVDKMSQDPEQANFRYIHANVYDNKFVSNSYVKQLESLPERKRKMYLEGSWDVFEGQFFSEFDPGIHVVRPFIPQGKSFLIGGLDWGRAKPFAFELDTVDRITMDQFQDFYRSRTFYEAYGTEKSPKEWSDKIVKELEKKDILLENIEWVRCDNQIFNKGNDMGKSIYDQFCDADERWRGKLKPASKDRVGGWENLHNWLSIAPDGLPYWQMTADCEHLVRTLPLLVYDTSGPNPEDLDSDSEDHAEDAERYMKKHLKWIDATAGGVLTDRETVKKPQLLLDEDGKQVGIDVTKWGAEEEHNHAVHTGGRQ